MSFGDRFCVSRKGGTGGGGWVHLLSANSMAVSWLGCRKAMVGTEWSIPLLFGINELRSKLCRLVGRPFPVFRGPLLSYARLVFWGKETFRFHELKVTISTVQCCFSSTFPGSLDWNWYVVVVVRVTYLLRIAEITCGSSLEPTAQAIERQMVWLRAIEAEIDLWSAVGGKGLNLLISCVCMG